jgi:predicted TIM-barrel fold metal-dependent hydrolase
METIRTPGRRAILAGAAAATLGAAASRAQGLETPVKYSAGTAPPRLRAPENATDCHHHVYNAQYPPIPNAALRPPDAFPDDYRALKRRLGSRAACWSSPRPTAPTTAWHLEALRDLGPERTRMVAVVNTEVTDEELRRMHGLGVRGIRFNLSPPGTTTLDMVEPLSRRVHALGWHCQFHMPPRALLEAGPVLERLPSRVVIDHLGRVPMDQGVNHPAYAQVRRLLDKGNGWVKLSGAYMDTKVGAAGNYADTVPVARGYATAAPERCVWASDWPHVTAPDPKPDDAQLSTFCRMGAGRGGAPAHPGGQPGRALRLPARGVSLPGRRRGRQRPRRRVAPPSAGRRFRRPAAVHPPPTGVPVSRAAGGHAVAIS